MERSEVRDQRSEVSAAALTGAGASVSPKGRERERRQIGSAVF